MKEKILRTLRENRDGYVSGAALCGQLGVSRQAVWKNITALKDRGFVIESVPNRGYRLLSVPDTLYAPDILSRLPESCPLNRVECFDTLDSTNIKAKQMAEIGEPEMLLITAENQTAGKGRRGRTWASEPGVGIWMTYLLRPEIPPSKVSGLTLLTALALTDALREFCGVEAQIKWPNDVIIAKKKICGILTEMSSEEHYVHYVVVGIGINANHTALPKEIEAIAGSILQLTGKQVDRSGLIAVMTEYFCRYYEQFCKEQDLSSFVEAYNAVLANRDKEVRIYYGMVENTSPEKIDTGIAKGIDHDGALLVEVAGEQKRIVSGEVSVRGLYGYV